MKADKNRPNCAQTHHPLAIAKQRQRHITLLPPLPNSDWYHYGSKFLRNLRNLDIEQIKCN